MTIMVGQRIPAGVLMHMTDSGPAPLTTDEIFKGKTVLLFAVPGAFTPTCSARHVPGFLEHAQAIHAKGVDSIVCLSVNDVFVMRAWAKDQNVDGRIVMVADGNGTFSTALGLTFDASKFGMGVRSQRFSLVAKDGVVTILNVEPAGEFGVSSAEHVLTQL